MKTNGTSCLLRVYCAGGDAVDKEDALVCNKSFADTVIQAIRKRRHGCAMNANPWLHL
jgi:hypothetical protein